MRLRCVHADHFGFEVTMPVGDGGETAAPADGRLEECLTAFVTVEQADGTDVAAVVSNAVTVLEELASDLNTARIGLYPADQHSEDSASAAVATSVLDGLERALTAAGYEVLRAPVEWHTAVDIAWKGHPLAEQSRRVTPQRPDAARDDAGQREYQVLWPDGSTVEASAATDDVGEDLAALVEVETGSNADEAAPSPATTHALVEQGFVGERSDADGYRWYPRGTFLRDLVTDYVTQRVLEFGGVPVETLANGREPRFDHRATLADLDGATADRPLTLYAVSRSCRGDGQCRRPELLTATADPEQARIEARRQAELARAIGVALGLDYEATIRVTPAVYAADRQWLATLVAAFDRPTLVELDPDADRPVRIDFAVVDTHNRPIRTARVAIDPESGGRIADADGERTNAPVLVKTTPAGAIERLLGALVDAAGANAPPGLPTWLAPTQVRFIPVDPDAHAVYAEELATTLDANGRRVDVDDRQVTVGTRLERAAAEWVPYYAVVGDRERDGGTLSVTIHRQSKEIQTSIADLAATVAADVAGYPTKPRYLPRRCSDYPGFLDRSE